MNPEPDNTPHWSPNTNIFLSEIGELIIKVDLSGINTGDVVLAVENQKLKLNGVRRDPEASKSSQVLVQEIPAGPFESALEIPDGFDLSASSSTFVNGILRICIPRKAGASEAILPPDRN